MIPRSARPQPSVPSDDNALAERIRAGDETAFGEFFRAQYAGVRSFVSGYLADAAAAEEIVQDVFWGVWQNRQTFGLRGSARAYLYQAARNRMANRLSRWRIERAWQAEAAREGERYAEDADYRVRERDAAEMIRRAVAVLPPRCRAVFVLSRGHGLSNVEIAQALEISPKTVEQQLWRAVAALRERLTDYRQ